MAHQFKDFFFHPTKSNVLVCLEQNLNNDTTEAYRLTPTSPGQNYEPLDSMKN